jgi:hypothetical protein
MRKLTISLSLMIFFVSTAFAQSDLYYRSSVVYRAVFCSTIKTMMSELGPDDSTVMSLVTSGNSVVQFCDDPWNKPLSSNPDNSWRDAKEAYEALVVAVAQSAKSTAKGLGGGEENFDLIGPSTTIAGGAQLPSESELLVGLTDFLIDRATDEVVYTVTSEMTDDVVADAVLTDMLPQTTSKLISLKSSKNTNFKTLLPLVRSAFLEDLDNLPVKIADKLLTGTPSPSTVVLVQSLKALNDIRNGNDIGQAIAVLADKSIIKDIADHNLRRALYFVGAIAQAYHGYNSVNMGISFGKTFTDYIAVPDNAEMFIALLVGDLANDSTLFGDRDENVAFCQSNFQNLITITEKISLCYKKMPATDSSLPDSVRLLNYGKFVQSCVQVLNLLESVIRDSNLVLKNGLDQIDKASRIEQALVTKDYGRAIVLTTDIYNGLANDGKGGARMKYISFFASIVTAKSSDEVSSALESLADPVGSFEEKRTNPGVVTINSYFAYSFGMETLTNSAPQRSINQTGLFVPVGLECSFGGCWHTSFLLGLIDIGTLASYRLSNSSAGQQTNVGSMYFAKVERMALQRLEFHLLLTLLFRFPLQYLFKRYAHERLDHLLWVLTIER